MVFFPTRGVGLDGSGSATSLILSLSNTAVLVFSDSSKAAVSSSTVSIRKSGLSIIAALMASDTLSGTRALRSLAGAKLSFTIREGASGGMVPVSILYSTAARAYTSVKVPGQPFSSYCSGAE